MATACGRAMASCRLIRGSVCPSRMISRIPPNCCTTQVGEAQPDSRHAASVVEIVNVSGRIRGIPCRPSPAFSHYSRYRTGAWNDGIVAATGAQAFECCCAAATRGVIGTFPASLVSNDRLHAVISSPARDTRHADLGTSRGPDFRRATQSFSQRTEWNDRSLLTLLANPVPRVVLHFVIHLPQREGVELAGAPHRQLRALAAGFAGEDDDHACGDVPAE